MYLMCLTLTPISDNCYTRDVESHKCVIACDGFDGHRPPENCTGSWLETDGYVYANFLVFPAYQQSRIDIF